MRSVAGGPPQNPPATAGGTDLIAQDDPRMTRNTTKVLNSSLELKPCRYLRPMANKLEDPRTYITPSDRAGVAIKSSPMELVAM